MSQNKARPQSARPAGAGVMPAPAKVTLEKVIGCTARTNSALAINPVSGDIAYPSGCIVVLYNAKRNKQLRFLVSKNNKPISAVTFSADGQFLAAAEQGHDPAVLVWDVAAGERVAELQHHKFGVSTICFSPDQKYLVSAGLVHDGSLVLWNWRQGTKVSVVRTGVDVHSVSFAHDSSFFVAVGAAYFRFFFLDPAKSGVVRPRSAGPPSKGASPSPALAIPSSLSLEAKPALFGTGDSAKFADLDWRDVSCGSGASAGFVYAVSYSGIVCSFTISRLLHSWVDLRTPQARSISVMDNLIACGCAHGVIRLFEAPGMAFVATLPKPAPIGNLNLGIISTGKSIARPSLSACEFPQTVASQLSVDKTRLISIYSDRSFFVWDISNPKKVGKSRSALAHSDCIWDVAMLPPHCQSFPENTFVTCASDSTIRFWSLHGSSLLGDATVGESVIQKNVFSKDLLRVIHVDTGNDGSESDVRGIRALAVAPDGSMLASGDRKGNIRVHNLKTFEQQVAVEAHDAEVLTLKYDPTCSFLASGSRDRLVHVFDVASSTKSNLPLLQSLDDHSSTVTGLAFAEPSSTSVHLLSCSADSSIVFRKYDKGTFVRERSASVQHGTVFDIALDATSKFVVSVGQDKKLTVWGIDNGKSVRSYKIDPAAGEQIKVTMDPSGTLCAVSSTDRFIRIFDFFSGQCIARVRGHAELVTGLAFTPDCTRLVSVSGDGCIFVWRLPADLTRNMRDRLEEISLSRTTAQINLKLPLPSAVIAAGVGSNTAQSAQNVFGAPPSPPISARSRTGSGYEDSKKSLHSLLSDISDIPSAPAPIPSATPDKAEETVVKEDVFSFALKEGSSAGLQEPEKDEDFAFHFRDKGAPLPSWVAGMGQPADKPMASGATIKRSTVYRRAKGRWAERLQKEGLVLFEEEAHAAVAPSSSLSPSDAISSIRKSILIVDKQTNRKYMVEPDVLEHDVDAIRASMKPVQNEGSVTTEDSDEDLDSVRSSIDQKEGDHDEEDHVGNLEEDDEESAEDETIFFDDQQKPAQGDQPSGTAAAADAEKRPDAEDEQDAGQFVIAEGLKDDELPSEPEAAGVPEGTTSVVGTTENGSADQKEESIDTADLLPPKISVEAMTPKKTIESEILEALSSPVETKITADPNDRDSLRLSLSLKYRSARASQELPSSTVPLSPAREGGLRTSHPDPLLNSPAKSASPARTPQGSAGRYSPLPEAAQPVSTSLPHDVPPPTTVLPRESTDLLEQLRQLRNERDTAGIPPAGPMHSMELPRPLDEYQRAIMNLQESFSKALAMFAEVSNVRESQVTMSALGKRVADDQLNDADLLKDVFDSLFSTMQRRLSTAASMSASAMQPTQNGYQMGMGYPGTRGYPGTTLGVRPSLAGASMQSSTLSSAISSQDVHTLLESYSENLVQMVMQKLAGGAQSQRR